MKIETEGGASVELIGDGILRVGNNEIKVLAQLSKPQMMELADALNECVSGLPEDDDEDVDDALGDIEDDEEVDSVDEEIEDDDEARDEDVAPGPPDSPAPPARPDVA